MTQDKVTVHFVAYNPSRGLWLPVCDCVGAAGRIILFPSMDAADRYMRQYQVKPYIRDIAVPRKLAQERPLYREEFFRYGITESTSAFDNTYLNLDLVLHKPEDVRITKGIRRVRVRR